MQVLQVSLVLVGLLSLGVRCKEQDTQNPIEHIEWANVVDEVGGGHHHSPIQVTVNVTEFSTKQAWVKVEWSGVLKPSVDDWVAVVAVADEKVKHFTPVKYIIAASSPEHMPNGSGSYTFVLANHRKDLRIAFITNAFSHPHVRGLSPIIRVLNKNRPSHGRLSRTQRPNEMVVQWTTMDTKGGQVKVGSKPGMYDTVVQATDFTYTREEMCGGAAKHKGWMDPGVFHFAVLTHLTPATRYYYVFGSNETGFSQEFSFVAAPRPGPDVAVKVLALADMGQSEPDGSLEESEMMPSLNTTRLLIRDSHADDYHLVVHYGDISYARGHVSQWDRYHEQIEPLVARLPYMTAIGNHERDWPGSGDRFPSQEDSGGECGVPHEKRFLMPTAELDEPWFSYNHGPIHFLHYSTEHPFHWGSRQHDFVQQDLQAVDRTVTPWVVFAGHRPMYIDSTNASPFNGDQTVAAELQAAFNDLLVQFGVDLTLHGHHHSYQRTCPAIGEECFGKDGDGVAIAPVHMVIGNAGAGLCYNVKDETPAIFEKVHVGWGYSRIFANGTALVVGAVSDRDGNVFDELVLTKPVNWGEAWHSKAGPPKPTQVREPWWTNAKKLHQKPAQVKKCLRSTLCQKHAGNQPKLVDSLTAALVS